MKKEVKVGLLGIVASVLLYYGFIFLKGSDVFSNVYEYKAKFKEVTGLEVSNPVTFNGVNVGRITNMEPDYKTGDVTVTMTVKKDVEINESSIAILADNGLLGGKMIKLSLAPGKAISEGHYIKGMKEGGMIDNVTQKIDPTLQHINELTTSLNKVVLEYQNTGQALKLLMGSATASTAGINNMLANNSKNVAAVTTNAAELTRNLNTLTNSLDAQIKPILTKSSNVADSLKALQLGQTVASLNNTIGNLQFMIQDINNGKGTIGKLKNDDSLYVNIDRTAASLNTLLADMKANPKRYVHFSLFGRKK